MLGIIKRNFVYISRNCFVTLYKSLVRSHLEYANSVWYPKRETDVDKLERVQKRAPKLIPELAKKTYGEYLRILNLPTLKYRRYRGDMIKLFKTRGSAMAEGPRDVLVSRNSATTKHPI